MPTSVQNDSTNSAGQVHIQAPVDGMSCASCAAAVETTLRSQSAVHKANVNFADRSVTIDFDAEQTSFGKLQEVVSDAGYTLLLPPASTGESRSAPRRVIPRLSASPGIGPAWTMTRGWKTAPSAWSRS